MSQFLSAQKASGMKNREALRLSLEYFKRKIEKKVVSNLSRMRDSLIEFKAFESS